MEGGGLDDISYGNLGLADYDADNQEWHFTRRLGGRGGLHVLEQSTHLLGSRNTVGEVSHLPRDAQQRLDIRSLLRSEPDLVPAVTLLPSLERVSEAASAVIAENDPLASDLLAIGTASDFDNRATGERYVKIFASVAGVSRQVVRLAYMTRDIRTCESFKEIHFILSLIGEREPGWWLGSQTPICQLCFSSNDGHLGGFLAVRRLEKTAILRPAVRRNPISAVVTDLGVDGFDTSSKLSPSHLDANFLLDIPMELTGQAPHASITFNPWFQRQFAIIDTNGCISTFTLEGPFRKRQVWELIKGPSISLSPQDDEVDSSVPENGWGAVLWVSDEKTILAASSRSLEAFVLEANEMIALKVPRLPVGIDGLGSVLDLKRDDMVPAHAYILTPTNLVLLSFLTSLQRETVTGMSFDVDILCSIRHHRSHQDCSLRIAIESDKDGCTVVFHSRASPLITGLRIYRSHKLSNRITCGDLFEIPMTRDPKVSGHAAITKHTSHRIASLSMQTTKLSFANDIGEDDHDTELEGMPRLIQIFALDEELNVRTAVCVDVETVKTIKDLEFPRHTVKHIRKIKAPALVQESYFIVPDGGLLADDENAEDFHESSKSEGRKAQSTPVRTWISGCQWLSDEITDRFSQSQEAAKSSGSFEEAIERILQNRADMKLGVHTLADFLSPSLPIDEVDKVSQITNELLDALSELASQPKEDSAGDEAESQRLKVLSLSTQESLRGLSNHSNDDTNALLISIYENLLSRCVQSLPTSALGRSRVWEEKIIRQASMQLFLALHGVQQAASEELIDEELDIGQQRELALPVRQKGDVKLSQASDVPFPEPGAGLEPRIQATASSLPAVPRLLPKSGLSGQPGYTLLQYSDVKVPEALSKLARKCVSEWEIGRDASSFHWQADSEKESQDDNRRRSGRRRGRKRKIEEEGDKAKEASSTDHETDRVESQISPTQANLADPVSPPGSSVVLVQTPLALNRTWGPLLSSQFSQDTRAKAQTARKKARKAGF